VAATKHAPRTGIGSPRSSGVAQASTLAILPFLLLFSVKDHEPLPLSELGRPQEAHATKCSCASWWLFLQLDHPPPRTAFAAKNSFETGAAVVYIS
jgi:hypothetical protein